MTSASAGAAAWPCSAASGASNHRRPRPPSRRRGPPPHMPNALRRALPCLLLAVAVGLFPLLARSHYSQQMGVLIGLALITLGLSLLMGYADRSVGQAAFFGLGAYTSAILTTAHLNPSSHCSRSWSRARWQRWSVVPLSCTYAAGHGDPGLQSSCRSFHGP